MKLGSMAHKCLQDALIGVFWTLRETSPKYHFPYFFTNTFLRHNADGVGTYLLKGIETSTEGFRFGNQPERSDICRRANALHSLPMFHFCCKPA